MVVDGGRTTLAPLPLAVVGATIAAIASAKLIRWALTPPKMRLIHGQQLAIVQCKRVWSDGQGDAASDKAGSTAIGVRWFLWGV